MIIDKENRFSNAQAITSSAASTDYIDLSVARDVAAGEPLSLVLQVTAAFSAGGITVTVDVEVDNDSAFGSVDASSRVSGLTGGAATFAALSAVGARRVFTLPPGLLASRYMRLNYTVSGGTLSTGAITAFLSSDPDVTRNYASGYTVLPA